MMDRCNSRVTRKSLSSAAHAPLSAHHARRPVSADAIHRANDEDGGVRFNRVCSFIASSLLLVAPQIAYAQDVRNVAVAERPRPEYDPLGLRFGGFNFNAALEVDAEYTDNLFAETSGREDYLFVARPEAQLTSNWSRHAVYANVAGAFRSYDEFTSENANSGSVAAGGRLDIGRDTVIGVEGLLAREVESRTDPGSVFTLDPVEYDVNRLGGYIEHNFTRVSLRLSATESTYDFQDSGVGFDQNLRDRTERDVTLRGEYAVTPRLSVLGQVISGEREYDIANASPNSDGVTYLLGAAFEISNLLRGEVSVGQFERDYTPTALSPNVDEVSGTAGSGRVYWFATPLTTITLGAARDVQESGYDRPYVNTSFSARVDHELLRNLILTGGMSSAKLDFEGIDRQDEAVRFDVGMRYLMNRRVSVNAAYFRNDTESDGLNSYRSFDENRVSLSVRFAL